MTTPEAHVIYLVIGDSRISAASHYVNVLAGRGQQVLLVTPDTPESRAIPPHPGVVVHRLNGDIGERTSAARRMLMRRDGPLRNVNLLIVGDAEATPVAWAIHRRFPLIEIRWEPATAPTRQTVAADLAVLTPWYPSPNNPLAGAFVKSTIRAVRDRFDSISIIHTEDWQYARRRFSGRVVDVAFSRSLEVTANRTVIDTTEGELTRIAIPTGFPVGYAARAMAHVKWASMALPTGRIEAPVVHAHTGIYGGVIAAHLARDDARVIVTEHATFLAKVLSDLRAARLYEQVLERADAMVCVGPKLRELIENRFPRYSDKLHVVPNPIDFDDFAMRPHPPADILRWLYVGRLVEHKGVITLVDAFAQIAQEEPFATLTLVGSGPLESAIRERIVRLGLAGRVELRPAVPPESVGGLMHTHDLLVHPSHIETFGMTVVEAVATGMPVLVARSNGPVETLSGIEDKAGLLVDVSNDPNVIAEGYRSLRKRLHTLDPSGARESMVRRYGTRAVSDQLYELYTGQPASRQAHRAVGRSARNRTHRPSEAVIIIAFRPRRIAGVKARIDELIGEGVGVHLIVEDARAWRRVGVPDTVAIHEVGTYEDRRPIKRTALLIAFALPDAAFGAARWVARRLRSPVPEAAVDLTHHLQRRVLRSLYGRVFLRAYQIVRPRILWRIVKRHILPDLDMSSIRAVLVADSSGVTVGWKLARRHPSLTASTSLSRPGPSTSPPQQLRQAASRDPDANAWTRRASRARK